MKYRIVRGIGGGKGKYFAYDTSYGSYTFTFEFPRYPVDGKTKSGARLQAWVESAANAAMKRLAEDAIEYGMPFDNLAHKVYFRFEGEGTQAISATGTPVWNQPDRRWPVHAMSYKEGFEDVVKDAINVVTSFGNYEGVAERLKMRKSGVKDESSDPLFYRFERWILYVGTVPFRGIDGRRVPQKAIDAFEKADAVRKMNLSRQRHEERLRRKAEREEIEREERQEIERIRAEEEARPSEEVLAEAERIATEAAARLWRDKQMIEEAKRDYRRSKEEEKELQEAEANALAEEEAKKEAIRERRNRAAREKRAARKAAEIAAALARSERAKRAAATRRANQLEKARLAELRRHKPRRVEDTRGRLLGEWRWIGGTWRFTKGGRFTSPGPKALSRKPRK